MPEVTLRLRTRSPASESGTSDSGNIDYDFNCVICISLSAFSGEVCSLLRYEYCSDPDSEEVCLRIYMCINK